MSENAGTGTPWYTKEWLKRDTESEHASRSTRMYIQQDMPTTKNTICK
eukprot:CAMPEP_0169139208 /NCGR_PEP_ID=MMETSP1015-20121227/42820_1 /TAXON_ID=342587 /ORGANISM="Karlodinium micrum, Strain CCMP2283" /LENGTH=47 /DNA_ID= /DNA_START= /DNA_END= /DNA_ORIENTATION=